MANESTSSLHYSSPVQSSRTPVPSTNSTPPTPFTYTTSRTTGTTTRTAALQSSRTSVPSTNLTPPTYHRTTALQSSRASVPSTSPMSITHITSRVTGSTARATDVQSSRTSVFSTSSTSFTPPTRKRKLGDETLSQAHYHHREQSVSTGRWHVPESKGRDKTHDTEKEKRFQRAVAAAYTCTREITL